MALPARIEQREYEKFDERTGGVKIALVEFRLGTNHNGEQLAVADTYSAATNRIDLGAACRHIVIHTDANVYVVFDSSNPAADLADASKRVYIPSDYVWERSFMVGKQVLDFLSAVAGVTAAVRVEAYE